MPQHNHHVLSRLLMQLGERCDLVFVHELPLTAQVALVEKAIAARGQDLDRDRNVLAIIKSEMAEG